MHLIKSSVRIVTLLSLVAAGVMGSIAQQARPSAKNSNAETGLVGVKLFDPGSKVIRLYGSPDEIQAIGTAGTGVSGGGGNSGGGGGGNSGGGGGDGSGQATRPPPDFSVTRDPLIGDPFNTGEGDWDIRQLRPNDGGGAGSPEAGGGREGGSSRAGGGGDAAGGSAESQRTIFTRWIYKRSTGKYAFVFDKANRVIQIEVVGMKDSKVRTRRGVTYGAFFGDLIKKYGAPDAYEINGTNLVVRFIVKDRVAFRLTKLDPKGKQRVTGIVIAAGKE